MKVGVIDYGVGNLGSVLRALEELRVAPVLISRPIDLHPADLLILPGVGNFGDCARLLHGGGWVEALRDEVLGGQKPMLGVCVGMQLLATCSAEGSAAGSHDGTPGLDLIPGRVEHLRSIGCSLRVPHVGWNDVEKYDTDCSLLAGIPDGTDFYFVHSYAFQPANNQDVLATSEYGVRFPAVISRGHVFGTQFHPEKSSRAGFRLLRNFVEGPGC
jgi:imidazole glycerol-phosphate synthase subunit HisH